MEGDRQSQIDQLVQSALALQGEERVSFLQEACSDPAIREEASRALSRLSHSPRPADSQDITQLAPPQWKDERINRVYGTYRVQSRIGAGGMGEVYLAFDTRLGRQVALKFLPAHTTNDETLVRRFEQEARTASGLNHPNILTIFDVGKIGNQHYLASEFVEGVTLRARLRQGPFDLTEALEVIVQVVSALVAAHSAGVIHRDLKPTNIMLRSDGYVKVIDFGLAKRTRSVLENEREEGYTRPGTMIGTVDYMSPEQTRGEKLDFRTDVWSVGVIFYEMLAGRKPFTGSSEYDLITQILTAEPKPESEPGKLPPEVERVLWCCLQKNREQRYPSAADLYNDLREARRALNLSSLTQAPARIGVARKRNWRGLLVIPAVFIVSLLCGWWWWNRQFGGPENLEYVSAKRVTSNGQVKLAVISPDGHFLAYAAGIAKHEALFIKPLDANETVLVPESDVSYKGVTFSNDGQKIYYVVRPADQEFGSLYKIPITQGDPQLVARDVDGPIAISPIGDEFAFVRNAGKKSQVVFGGDFSGTNKEPALEFTDVIHKGLAWSKQGNKLALFVYPNSDLALATVQLCVVDTGSKRVVRKVNISGWRRVSQPVWANNKDLLVAAATPDETSDRMQIREVSSMNGQTRNLTTDIYGFEGISQTSDGQKLVTVRRDRQTRFWFSALPNLDSFKHGAADSGQYYSASWTDDNKIIAQANRGDGVNVWLLDPASSHLQKLTDGRMVPRDPVWLLHHRSLVFAAAHEGNYGIWRFDLSDGSYTLLTKSPDYLETPVSMPDGEHILYTAWHLNLPQIWMIPAQPGKENPKMLLDRAENPAISSDGTQFAAEVFDQNKNTWQVNVYDLATLKLQIVFSSIPVGSKLKWHPGGSGLDYLRTAKGISNVWTQPLSGTARALTHSEQDEIEIFDFAWSPAGNRLVCLRGQTIADGILLQRKK